jgi:hypothetical protein
LYAVVVVVALPQLVATASAVASVELLHLLLLVAAVLSFFVELFD